MKRALAIILVLSLVITIVWVANPFSPSVKASADTYRHGFSIIPDKMDATGILPEATFILTSESTIDVAYLKENLTIRGLTQPDIKADGKNFILTPTSPLPENKLIFFDLKATDGTLVTFTFQTRQSFGIIGVFPGATTTNVPVDSGIEVYFTHKGVKDFEKYFEISPNVSGKFEMHGNAAVFVPKKLDVGTLYTVTIKKGLSLAESGQTLANDFTFRFETAPDDSVTANPDQGWLSITNPWLTNDSTSIPVIPFDFNLPGSKQGLSEVQFDVSVYQYPSLDAFMKAIKTRDETPSWAWYNYSQNQLDHKDLTEVFNFKPTINPQDWNNRYVSLPKNPGKGFYLVQFQYEGLTAQALLQVTDTLTYYIEDKDTMIFWLNDATAGGAITGAEIVLERNQDKATTDTDGIAKLIKTKPAAGSTTETPPQDYFVITTASGEQSIVNAGASADVWAKDGYFRPYVNEDTTNWRYIGMDRQLYKPNDTVQFWGFIKNRVTGNTPENLTIELGNSGYGFYSESRFIQSFLPFMNKPLYSAPLTLQNGFFDSSLLLPNLDAGWYTLTLKSGDTVIASSGFSVDDYTKPAYKIEVTTDKKAVALGENTVFTIKTSFFEGTPVAGLTVNYQINDWNNNQSGTGVTGNDGTFQVSYASTFQSGMQGQSQVWFSATAQLPESGEIIGNTTVAVYPNDINVAVTGESDKDVGTIKVNVNKLNLAPLNDEDPDNDGKSIAAAVAGQVFNGTITRRWWDQVETGETYDFINKVVVKQYEYVERTETIKNFSITTDGNGAASLTFQMPEGLDGYYTAEFTTVDSADHTMQFSTWHYRNNQTIQPYYSNYYELRADKESYKDGEAVTASVYHNNELLNVGRTLFVTAHLGIQDAAVAGKPVYQGTFDDSLAPNVNLYGVVFNGKGYTNTYTNLNYNTEEKRIKFTITPDKEGYRPGETASIRITAVDQDGKPVAATVNLALVDEAMFQLSEQYVDVLASLYSWVDSGILRESNGNAPIHMYGGRGELAVSFSESASDGMYMAKDAAAPTATGASMEQANFTVRSDFRDTAYYKTVALAADGTGTLTFKLPDNVTTWRVSVSGISSDLHAGFEKATAQVTIPFFMSEVVNNIYLVGDKPMVGVTAYGTNLTGNENITYELTSAQKPDFKQTIEAKAFERVYLPLWQLEEGTFDIEIRALSSSGDTDAIRRTVKVVRTYQEMWVSQVTAVAAGMTIPAGKDGLTTWVFVDKERSQLINSLLSLSWSGGKRLDQRLTAEAAKKALLKILPEDQTWFTLEDIDVASYKREDGGYGILPYAESDLAMTALLTSFLKDNADNSSLKNYFYTKAYATERISPEALYGLAVLGEPVLLDLQAAAEVENLSEKEYMFIGMGLAALGETPAAYAVYEKHILPLLEKKDPYVRVKTSDKDDTYALTAMAAAFAASIGSSDADALYQYTANNWSKEVYIGVENALYAIKRLEQIPNTEVSFSYSRDGKEETKLLKNGESFMVTIPSALAANFKVLSSTGNLSVISSYTAPFKGSSNDPDVSVVRSFYNEQTGEKTTSFKEGDIIRVELAWNINTNAIDNTYDVTDYLPSGLTPIDSPWQYDIQTKTGWWYRDFDGQKVSFVIGKNWTDKQNLVYYARVTSPGQYVAESPIVQGNMVKTSLFVGDTSSITIAKK